jgi:hypothetical protein
MQGTVKVDGSVSVKFTNPSIILGNSYWISINHENSVETWSAAPVTLDGVTPYLFSSFATQAFGSNMVQVQASPAIWAIFTGDINQDGSVDISDYLVLDPDIQNGNGGYIVTDLNGDGASDITDYLYMDPNIQNGVGAFLPTP